MKAYGRVELSPCVLDLGTRWRSAVTFTLLVSSKYRISEESEFSKLYEYIADINVVPLLCIRQFGKFPVQNRSLASSTQARSD
jgi:hypothetical protein